jgi:AcrR family transcriptional regulator
VTAPRPDGAPSPRGEQTRTHIVDTALRLFRERGYEATTMRAIATEAGVSVGNAYYYFPSKQHLVQAYYQQSQDLHAQAARPVLDEERSFEARLHGVLRARTDTMQSEKEFAVSFFRYAADPASPLSPFSAESGPAREMSTALYAEAVEGAVGLKVPPELREELPELLWLYQMGVVLFWVHDRSPGARRTYALIDRTVPLVVRLVALARYRVLRGLVTDLLELFRDLRDDPDGPPERGAG